MLLTIGGPLQTILTGTIGFLILLWRSELIFNKGMKPLDWLAAFLSLFWLREIFNLLSSIGGELIHPNGTWFGGDELHISQELNLWNGTFSIVCAIIGCAMSYVVIFSILPKKNTLDVSIKWMFWWNNGFYVVDESS